MNAAEEDKLPENELLAQMSYVSHGTLDIRELAHIICPSTFILAGMDTTSTALSITLTLLSEHPEVQEKLRKEILEASKGEPLDYDDLVSLPYLDAVCRESLRL